jgi:cell division initiation protein
MFTPSEIKEKQFKNGLGYDKKDVEQFLHELSSDYDALLQENADSKKKLNDMNESLAYYKSIEKTLQKALILAEKTAQDTRACALKEAEAIEKEAKIKASQLLSDSRNQIEAFEHRTMNLMQQYDMFKIHFENLLHAQIELLNSKSFSVNTDDFSYREASEDNRKANAAVISEAEQVSLAAASIEPDQAAFPEEDIDQIHFDFLDEKPEKKSYQTEDGFEFFEIEKDNQ